MEKKKQINFWFFFMTFKTAVATNSWFAVLTNSRYGESVERMTTDELEQGKKWLGDTFYLIRWAERVLLFTFG